MNVHLGDTFDRFVADLLATGLYQSQSEVIREGLRLLKEREDLRQIRLKELRQEIQKGIDQLDRGEFTTYSNPGDLAKEIKAKGRERLRKSQKG